MLFQLQDQVLQCLHCNKMFQFKHYKYKKKTINILNINHLSYNSYVGLANFWIFLCLSIKVWNICWTSSLISKSAAKDIFNKGCKKLGGNVVFICIVWYFVPTCVIKIWTINTRKQHCIVVLKNKFLIPLIATLTIYFGVKHQLYQLK